MIGREYIFIWPIYFDANRTRSEGRRVPSGLAVSNPTAEKIALVLKGLGYEAILDASKNHPSDWFNFRGLVMVPKAQVKVRKAVLLRKVAKALRNLNNA